MSHGYASRHRGGGGGGMSATTLLAAKVVLASAALAAAASFARLAVPELVSAAGAVFPRVWAVARFWLAPPYLFVTVHLIILVIWKLSDHKHLHAQQAAHPKDPWPAAAVAVHACSVEEVVPALSAAKAKEEYGGHLAEPDYSSPDLSPDSGSDSCVTTESSDEDASSAPAMTYDYSGAAEARRSVAPPVRERAVLELGLSQPSSQSVDCEGDDDMDATWNAIMRKTRSAPAAPVPPVQQSPPPRARDPSVGAEEMNRRFDDFIKKNRNSFGRQ